ncbi:MAG: hypothetical protein WKG06_19190 [Segetibacter sp.]
MGYVGKIEDETQLEMLNEAAAYSTKQTDILDLLTPDQLKRLEESIEQADQGKIITHEEAMKIALQWLTK